MRAAAVLLAAFLAFGCVSSPESVSLPPAPLPAHVAESWSASAINMRMPDGSIVELLGGELHDMLEVLREWRELRAWRSAIEAVQRRVPLKQPDAPRSPRDL